WAQRAEPEAFVERPVPRDVAERRERDGGESLRLRPVAHRVDEPPSDALAASSGEDVELLEMRRAIEHARHREAQRSLVGSGRHPDAAGALMRGQLGQRQAVIQQVVEETETPEASARLALHAL